MDLYSRDYHNISQEEKKEWEKVKEREKVNIGDNDFEIHRSLYHEYPKAVKHYLSHFPNNFLDATDLSKSQDYLIERIIKFKDIISNKETTEQDILNFIKEEAAYFLVGSILKKNYQFGHHDLYLFPEFKLPPNYIVDYLLVGKNSDGHHFVFVEFENPYNRITKMNGEFGETIRKGTNQIDNWKTWLDENFSSLRPVFEKALNKDKSLPREFTQYDKTRIHFTVVAGRRVDFNKKTYRLKRRHLEQQKILIIHYDNILEYGKELLGESTY